MDDDDVLDDAHAVDTAAAKDLETDDSPHERREEFAFAEVLPPRASRRGSPREAAGAFEEACWERSFELREESASCVHRAVKAAELARAADLLQAEAGTWSLVWFLLGDGAAIEADGAASEAAARAVIARRQAAGGDPASAIDSGVPNPAPTPIPLSARIRIAARDFIGDPVTFRLNRVVAWLEGTARAAMQRERAGLVPVPDEHAGTHVDDFASGECAWRETAVALDASATTDGRGRTACAANSDPDGPSRTSSALHPTNADGEDRLLRATWRLTRAGDGGRGGELCARHASQPWRAASLGGAAGFAPAPVGANFRTTRSRGPRRSPLADARSSARRRRRRLARILGDASGVGQSDGGCGSVGCGGEGGRGGGVRVRTRGRRGEEGARGSGRDAETARQTSAWANGNVASYSRFESALYGAFAGDRSDLSAPATGTGNRCVGALQGAAGRARVDAVIDGGIPAPPGPFSWTTTTDGSGDGKRKLADCALQRTASSGEADVVGAGLRAGLNQVATPRWPTPEALAAIPPTAEAILDALKPLGGNGEHRRAQGCLILGRTRELVVDNVLSLEEEGWTLTFATLDGDVDEASVHAALVDSPVRSPELLRLRKTHLLLFLRELLPDGGGLQPDGPLDRHLNAVVARFVLHLVQSKRYHLVPRYARHLRASLLVETYHLRRSRRRPRSSRRGASTRRALGSRGRGTAASGRSSSARWTTRARLWTRGGCPTPRR